MSMERIDNNSEDVPKSPDPAPRWLLVCTALAVVVLTLLIADPFGESDVPNDDQVTEKVTTETEATATTETRATTTTTDAAPSPGQLPFDENKARRLQDDWAEHLGVKSGWTNTAGMELRLIPPGSMEVNGKTQLTVSEPFFIGAHEVTIGQFRQFVDATGHKEKAGGWTYDNDKEQMNYDRKVDWRQPGYPVTDDQPVVFVDSETCQSFCEWLSDEEGFLYRLPTESEWEYASRAGSLSRYWTGDEFGNLQAVANIADQSFVEELPDIKPWQGENPTWQDSWPFTAPVGSFKPNPFGLYDVHGNVGEQVLSQTGDPSSARGSFYRGEHYAEIENLRTEVSPTTRLMELGFRVVREVAPIEMSGPPPLSTTQTDETVRPEVPGQPQVSISPPGGFFREAQTVRIDTMGRPGRIYFTLDGTSPTQQSPIYSTPFSVRETTNLQVLFVGSFRRSVSREFVVDPAASRLDPGDDSWRVLDATGDDVHDGPSRWTLSEGVVTQSSNIYQGKKSNGPDVRRDGTLRFYSGTPPQHDEIYYEVKSDDDDAVGMAFRVQNDQNYYLYAMDHDRGAHVLALVNGDEYRVLAKVDRGYVKTPVASGADPAGRAQTCRLLRWHKTSGSDRRIVVCRNGRSVLLGRKRRLLQEHLCSAIAFSRELRLASRTTANPLLAVHNFDPGWLCDDRPSRVGYHS